MSPSRLLLRAAGLLLAAASTLCAQITATQYAVTGNISGISGQPTDLLQTRFTLVNCGSATPTVTGVTIPVKTAIVFTAASNGNITGALWGNDSITCNGAATTLYQLTYLRNNVPAGVSVYYRIAGPFNLTTATPVTVLPSTVPLASGFSCPAGNVMVGLLANFQPVCQFLQGNTIYASGLPSPSACTTTATGTYIDTDVSQAGANTFLCINGAWVQQGGNGTGGARSSSTPAGAIPSGTINGTNTAFTLPSAPIANSLIVQLNGLSVSYTLSGVNVTINPPPSTGDTLYANWFVASTGGSSSSLTAAAQTPTGTVDGTNQTFTLAYTPASGSLLLSLNGLILSPAVGYSTSGSTLTLTPAPGTGDVLYATYYH